VAGADAVGGLRGGPKISGPNVERPEARTPSTMSEDSRRRAIHDLDATVRVGKHGVESVAEELAGQLETRDLVKVKFLRAARGGSDTETLAADLAEAAGATLLETRGHTAVYER